MPTPFPGMDPYLEHPELWPSVHLGLISAIWMDLAPRLSPRYTVSVEERTYIAANEPDSFIGRADVLVASDRGPAPVRPGSNGGVMVREPVAIYVPAPDVVTERYLEVRNVQYGYVVTVIELLSPSNKRPGTRGFPRVPDQARDPALHPHQPGRDRPAARGPAACHQRPGPRQRLPHRRRARLGAAQGAALPLRRARSHPGHPDPPGARRRRAAARPQRSAAPPLRPGRLQPPHRLPPARHAAVG